ncbi:MAG: hypothetical protein IJ094_10075 [Bacilli bacterium]|nr:hypothetical protein [Bacilli bacterium]
MEKQRGVKALSIVALVAAIIGLTVAFAAMSRTLTINGSAKMDTATWDIHYENLSAATLTGGASVPNPDTATIKNGDTTTIENIDMTVTKPGDSVTYTFDVVNSGTINAKIGTLTKQLKPNCAGTGANADADAALVCGNLTYEFKYTTDGAAVAENDTLSAGQTKNLTLKLSYDGTTLPADDVNLTGMDITTIYVQD